MCSVRLNDLSLNYQGLNYKIAKIYGVENVSLWRHLKSLKEFAGIISYAQ